jgi:hypothetical protein
MPSLFRYRDGSSRGRWLVGRVSERFQADADWLVIAGLERHVLRFHLEAGHLDR